MKKILALLLALSMLVLLSACGDKTASNDKNSDSKNDSSTVYVFDIIAAHKCIARCTLFGGINYLL